MELNTNSLVGRLELKEWILFTFACNSYVDLQYLPASIVCTLSHTCDCEFVDV